MMTEGKHEGDASEKEDVALWSLLDRGPRPPQASPYFARRVLREVAEHEDARRAITGLPGWWGRILQAWGGQGRGVFAGALGAVALLAAGARLTPSHWESPTLPAAVSEGAPLAFAAAAPSEMTAESGSVEAGSPTPRLAAADPTVTAQDVEVIADLDNLLSHEESRLWTEDDNTARF